MPRKKKAEYQNPDFTGWKGEPYDGSPTEARFNSRYWRDVTPVWLAGEVHERNRGGLGIPHGGHWVCTPMLAEGRFSIGFSEDGHEYTFAVWEFTQEELERRAGGRLVVPEGVAR